VDQQISVVLKNGERYGVQLTATEREGFDAASARHWIGEAFAKAGLETSNPVGKVLLVDQILLLAGEFDAAAYAQPTPELRRFLAAAYVAMGRPLLAIDLHAWKV